MLIVKVFAAAILLSLAASAAYADVTISSGETRNVSCSGGTCAPTASAAVLNVSDLENMLAAGNVEVTTTGRGVQADNIAMDSPLMWSSSNTLALDAYQSITTKKPVTVSGVGGMSVMINDGGSGGTFSFREMGRVTFANLSSALTINGVAFTLKGDIKSLADAIASNPAGDYALANAYDASKDGTYSLSPIAATLTGTLEGLGNSIRNLTIAVARANDKLEGLLEENDGTLRDLRLMNATVVNLSTMTDPHYQVVIGGLAAYNQGQIDGSSVTGTIQSNAVYENCANGGLVGINGGSVEESSADVTVAGPCFSGGLVGENVGTISESFATGAVPDDGGLTAGGGLAGYNDGQITDSYAAGSTSTAYGFAGGLVGDNDTAGTIRRSYSTGHVSGYNDFVAGFIGVNGDSGSRTIEDGYWDTQTSGTGTGVGFGPSSGVTGLTTKQFRRSLPHGFSPHIWAEKPDRNGGFPYLVANPPQ